MFDLRRLNGLPARRRTFGLFSWIYLDCEWQTRLAVLSVQLQSKVIQLNRPKVRLLAGRSFNLCLCRSNIVSPRHPQIQSKNMPQINGSLILVLYY